MAAGSSGVPNSTAATRAILAASAGNLLEWYDFSVYALFAIYIGANFFPSRTPGLDLVKAFLVFGLGFIIRPLGAIVIGIYGDRAGRKAALTTTILIMACGTGVSLVYNAAITIFGGFAPAILTWFTATKAGSVFAPGWYVALAAVPAILAILYQSRRTARVPAGAVSEPLSSIPEGRIRES